ncbi:MAG: ChaN family lipoprotein [Planctomycetota bacterium]|jgi:hypothetical protein
MGRHFGRDRTFPAALVALVALLSACALGAAAGTANPADAASKPRDVNDMKNIDYDPFVTYLRESGKPPIDYVVSKFKDHDVVMLGEMHEIKEYLRLYADLLDPLYHKANVRVLAIEILKSKHNDELARLVTAAEYDREGVLDVFRDEFRGAWGFKEYVDLVEAVWRLNSTLPEGAEKLLVIGLASDMNILKPETVDFEANERNAVEVISREILEKGRKGLVPIGYNHTFLKYRQPTGGRGRRAGPGKGRLGFQLYEKYGDRVFQVCLHLDHMDAVAMEEGEQSLRPVLGGLVERVFRMNGSAPVGFDVVGSPFANLRDRKSYYFRRQNKVTFADIAAGYIIVKPYNKLDRKMTWVEGFITERNFEKARAFMIERGIVRKGRKMTPQELDRLFKRAFEGR